MPWNRFYHSAGAFSQADKEAIAKGVTDIYAEVYPRSTTLVAFFPVEEGSFFEGGKVVTNKVRITLQFMRGTYNTYELENVVRTKFRDSWKPYIEGKGLTYELQIEEIPSNEISFDNYVSNTILGEPLLKDMVKNDEIYPLKTVRA